ncbi:Hypothetical predicted protein [Paramuricea clavata]|uniref:Matrix-remodeling-associated protein 7 helical domain-containing protein n=1 Tax=Paramuricea clavata TaxID=317549 RepID=A0A6S7JCV3_PARCT|nr:Hypothetical predicted protein [Paramuricea clavata]
MYYLWLPVSMAFLSIFLMWFWMQWREKQDRAILEEDKSLTEEIKTNLNPDMLSTSSCSNMQPCTEVVNHERNVSEKCEDVEEKEVERRIEQEQLKQIFELMENDKAKYGIGSMEDVEEQMKRYKT